MTLYLIIWDDHPTGKKLAIAYEKILIKSVATSNLIGFVIPRKDLLSNKG